jgi:hypothetical protein
MTENKIRIIGWIATGLCVSMYFSYIDQISRNLAGHPGSVILPIITTLNSIAWVLYGFSKQKKDWPIIVSNVPGIILGAVTAITAF